MQDEPSGGGGGDQKATNVTADTQTDKDGNITGETRTETTAQLNEDGSYTIHSVKEQKTYDDKGEVAGYSRSEYTESGDNSEFVSEKGQSIMNDAFGNSSAEAQIPSISTSPADLETPKLAAPKQAESKAPEPAPSPSVAEPAQQQENSQVDALGVIRETANMWASKTGKLLDWAGDVSKVAKLFRGAGTILGLVGIGFTVREFFQDIKTKPAWVAWTKGIVGVGLGVAGLLTAATPVGWAVLAVGFTYGMLENTGAVDKGLMWMDRNVVNPQPQYIPR
tara:strand:- start:1021 stop:1857 length:837 start_codon:yes stop_codon:yes gene_type:complete